jgi:branched-chain amino acid transport system ATP-binding protein
VSSDNETVATMSSAASSRAAVDLQITDVAAGYGRAEILHGVTLTVPKGQVTAVLGRNGVGKTTLLRCLSGLLPANRGRIALGGEDITGWSSAKRVQAGLAHVPEGRRMVAGFNVRQMLQFGAYVLPLGETGQRLDEILTLFPIIKDWLRRDSTSLSGGQQQLVAIARALMCRARILMLDEPLTGLAPSVAINVLDSVKELSRQGLTILLVEQNVHMAMDVADGICVLDAGRVAILDDTGRAGLADQIERTYLGVELTNGGSGA